MNNQQERYIECKLTADELLRFGKDHANQSVQRAALENELDRIKADFKARMAKLDADSAIAVNAISSGSVHRMVICEVLFEHPRPSVKTIIRTDTNEIVAEESMTENEKQLSVAIQNTTKRSL